MHLHNKTTVIWGIFWSENSEILHLLDKDVQVTGCTLPTPHQTDQPFLLCLAAVWKTTTGIRLGLGVISVCSSSQHFSSRLKMTRVRDRKEPQIRILLKKWKKMDQHVHTYRSGHFSLLLAGRLVLNIAAVKATLSWVDDELQATRNMQHQDKTLVPRCIMGSDPPAIQCRKCDRVEMSFFFTVI